MRMKSGGIARARSSEFSNYVESTPPTTAHSSHAKMVVVKPTNYTELNPGIDYLAPTNKRNGAFVMHSNPEQYNNSRTNMSIQSGTQ